MTTDEECLKMWIDLGEQNKRGDGYSTDFRMFVHICAPDFVRKVLL